jgi:hypothetical protein
MAYVYWIRLPERTDILTEGYIGVTSKSSEERFKGHLKDCNRKDRNPYRIQNVLRKYKDVIVVETLLIADLQYCYDVEQKLRPLKKIGWNTAAGGRDALSLKDRGAKHTEESKAKMRAVQKETWQRDDIKTLKIGKILDRRVPKPIDLAFEFKRFKRGRKPHLWEKAQVIYEMYISTPLITSKDICKALNFEDNNDQWVCRLIRAFMAGFIPKEDPIWVERFIGESCATHT